MFDFIVEEGTISTAAIECMLATNGNTDTTLNFTLKFITCPIPDDLQRGFFGDGNDKPASIFGTRATRKIISHLQLDHLVKR